MTVRGDNEQHLYATNSWRNDGRTARQIATCLMLACFLPPPPAFGFAIDCKVASVTPDAIGVRYKAWLAEDELSETAWVLLFMDSGFTQSGEYQPHLIDLMIKGSWSQRHDDAVCASGEVPATHLNEFGLEFGLSDYEDAWIQDNDIAMGFVNAVLLPRRFSNIDSHDPLAPDKIMAEYQVGVGGSLIDREIEVTFERAEQTTLPATDNYFMDPDAECAVNAQAPILFRRWVATLAIPSLGVQTSVDAYIAADQGDKLLGRNLLNLLWENPGRPAIESDRFKVIVYDLEVKNVSGSWESATPFLVDWRAAPGEIPVDGDGNYLAGFRKTSFHGRPAIEASFGYGLSDYVQDGDPGGVDPDTTCGVIDLADSTSCLGQGVPVDCERDCNRNGVGDSCDIFSGSSTDCNLNDIPDECEVGLYAYVNLDDAFCSAPDPQGFTYESYADNRPGASPGPGHEQVIPMSYAGVLSIVNGSVEQSGPTYTSPSFFPYFQHVIERGLVIGHPAAGPTDTGASVAYTVSQAGNYHVFGAFARQNDQRGAGDGVEVSVFKNFDSATPFFSAAISSEHIVNGAYPFFGTGTTPFDFWAPLAEGDVLRLVVFAGAPGASDMGWDATALRLSMELDVDSDDDGILDSCESTGVGDSTEDARDAGLELAASPNPFNPTISLAFSVPHAGQVEIRVFDLQGQLVATVFSAHVAAGSYNVTWDGTNKLGEPMASGVYFVHVRTATATVTKSVVLLK